MKVMRSRPHLCWYLAALLLARLTSWAAISLLHATGLLMGLLLLRTGRAVNPSQSERAVGPQSSAGGAARLQPLPPGSKGGLQASL